MSNSAKPFAMLLIACSLLAGCKGEPRLDTSSDASLRASTKAMMDGLDDAKKKQVEGAIVAVTVPAMMKAAFDPSAPKPTQESIFKPFHGMTADEIIARGEAAKAAIPPTKKP